MRRLLLTLIAAPAVLAQIYSGNLPLRHPAIGYFDDELRDPASLLAKELDAGKVRLDFREGPMGYLPSLLRHLDVSADSQTLVFSKTSFQAAKISPRNPRALYFNDTVAVGYVPGGTILEVAAVDPTRGVVFYAMDTGKTDQPRLTRREVCLTCHQGPATQGVPGLMVGSVFPNADGSPSKAGAIITDHRTPFEDRWGGWFLDRLLPSRGSSVTADPEGNLAIVARRFDETNYPVPTSDPVALMTLEHQTQMINLFTRLAWLARMDDPGVEAAIRDVVRYLTFADEAPLPEPVRGTSTFAQTFGARGADRDFDLKTRVFRARVSYMIHTKQFAALPAGIQERISRALP